MRVACRLLRMILVGILSPTLRDVSLREWSYSCVDACLHALRSRPTVPNYINWCTWRLFYKRSKYSYISSRFTNIVL